MLVHACNGFFCFAERLKTLSLSVLKALGHKHSVHAAKSCSISGCLWRASTDNFVHVSLWLNSTGK